MQFYGFHRTCFFTTFSTKGSITGRVFLLFRRRSRLFVMIDWILSPPNIFSPRKRTFLGTTVWLTFTRWSSFSAAAWSPTDQDSLLRPHQVSKCQSGRKHFRPYLKGRRWFCEVRRGSFSAWGMTVAMFSAINSLPNKFVCSCRYTRNMPLSWTRAIRWTWPHRLTYIRQSSFSFWTMLNGYLLC